MAESVREVERNGNEKIRLMSENGEFLSADREKQLGEESLDNLKSLFYLNNGENRCYSKYSVDNDGVNRASEFCPDVDGFSSEYKGICPSNEENCRKKRCSDRYDSSESSDSGIAVSSSASSGTSDITDPGSPFSTSSDDSSSSPGKCKGGKRCKSEEKSLKWSEPIGRCRSEEKTWTETWEGRQEPDKTDHNFITPETDFKMAPNVPSASSPCDVWTSIAENNTANETAHFNHFKNTQSEAISNKRLKPDANDPIGIKNNNNNNNNNIVANVPSPIISKIEADAADARKKSSGDNCDGAKVKMRRSSYECAKSNKDDGGKTSKSGGKTLEKKQDRNRHQGKITEYFRTQIKSLAGMKRDFGSKKDVGNKPKPAEEPPSKKAKAEEASPPVFAKPSPVQTAMPSREASRVLSLTKLPKAAADFLLKKPAEPKTLFNKILENHKNRKLAESYMKCRTVPKPKSAAETEIPKSNHKPYDTSTRNNVTEMPKTKVEEFSSNLQDIKVQKDLDSNLLNVVSNVTEVISSRSDATEADSSQSPILSAPKTIRFPAVCHDRTDKQGTSRESIPCRWEGCSTHSDSASGLLEHLQSAHVLTQVSGEKFVCLWVGCKVFDQKSCSRSWLERHVLSHAGNKPFRCIVDGCGQGFSTQAILERHVNNHFVADVKKALDNSIVHKLFRRNGKKLRYRRQPWSARMFDFFDSGIMEGLEHRLVKLTKARTGGDIADIPGKSLALTSQVVARRLTENGKHQFLLRWFPQNIVEDEWVYEEEVTRKKTVSIPSLSPSVSSRLQETLELVTRSSASYRTCRRKNRRPITPDPIPLVEETPKDSPEPAEAVRNPAAQVAESTKSLTPTKKLAAKKAKAGSKKKKTPPEVAPAASAATVDVANDGTLTTEKTVSLRPKEETPTMVASPEEMSVVPVCPPAEDVVPVRAGGAFVDGAKILTPVKTEMVVGSPLKLIASQYVEQPFVQAVMPLQVPVAYQIPIVKLAQSPGMFFPQMPNYVIPQSPPVFPASSMTPFRNGFQFSTTGTIQIQASSTTLQQTASTFVQSTNASGFQIVQSPTSIQQSILTAFQNSSLANLDLKSPTLRLLNCQPLILNGPKPVANVSLTLTNVSAIASGNGSALAVPTVPAVAALPSESSGGAAPARKPPATATKKLVKQKPNILPKPNIAQKSAGSDGATSKKQCLQSCGPGTAGAT